MSGAGRYVVDLARRLPSLDRTLELTVLLRPALKRTPVPTVLEEAGARVVYADAEVLSLSSWAVVPLVLRRLRPDLYHYPHFDLPFVPYPSVVTIYDLNPLLLRAYFTRQPGLRRLVAYRLVRSTLRRCRMAMTISDTSARLMLANFPEAQGKLRTVRLGVDVAHWSAATTFHGDNGTWGTRPYVLYVGVERPHKNLVRLVRGFARFQAANEWHAGQAPYLWLAGVGAGSRELNAEIERQGVAANVRLSDGLSEAELIHAYRGARVVAFVSIAEGFGLPILEAFAAGVPLVAGNASCLPEVAGDAATYVTPEDEAEIAWGLTETWQNEAIRQVLIARGARRLREFTWEETARQTLEVYALALERKSV